MKPGEHKRKPNGILGLLCRQHFPRLVMHAGVLEPAYTWDHYMASPDATDREGRNFTTKARQVVGELWVSHSPTKMVFCFNFCNDDCNYLVGIYAGFLQVRGRL